MSLLTDSYNVPKPGPSTRVPRSPAVTQRDESSESDSSDEHDGRLLLSKRKAKRGRPPVHRRKPSSDEPGPSTRVPRSAAVTQPDESSESDSSDEHDGRLSKRKAKRGRPPVNKRKLSSDEDFVEPSQVVANKKNMKKHFKPSALVENVDDGVFKNLVDTCVYFLLIEDRKKYAIKRKDIIQHIFKSSGYSPKLYNNVLKEAGRILKQIYGLELMALGNQIGSYLIVNHLPRELDVHTFCEMSEFKLQQYGFILYALTVIFMSGNSIIEDDFWKAVKHLGIDVNSPKPHPVFGDVKRFVTVELVKQMYLSYECVDKDPPRYNLAWGPRAAQEVDKQTILEFACEIMNSDPQDWTLQFRDAEREGEGSRDKSSL